MSLETLTTTNLITIAGWPVGFLFGLLSAHVIQKRSKTRRLLTWSVVTESNLLARDVLDRLESGFGMPIKVLVNSEPQSDLSTIRIRLTSLSTVEIRDVKLYFNFGSSAIVHVGRLVGEVGVYGERLSLTRRANIAELSVAYINPAQSFDVEFLVANYELGRVLVDMAEPGVILRLAKIATPERSVLVAVYSAVAAAMVVLIVSLIVLSFTFVVMAQLRKQLQQSERKPDVIKRISGGKTR